MYQVILNTPRVARELSRTRKVQTFVVDTTSLSDNRNFKQSEQLYHIKLSQAIKSKKVSWKISVQNMIAFNDLEALNQPWQWRCTELGKKRMQYCTEKVSNNIQFLHSKDLSNRNKPAASLIRENSIQNTCTSMKRSWTALKETCTKLDSPIWKKEKEN